MLQQGDVDGYRLATGADRERLVDGCEPRHGDRDRDALAGLEVPDDRESLTSASSWDGAEIDQVTGPPFAVSVNEPLPPTARGMLLVDTLRVPAVVPDGEEDEPPEDPPLCDPEGDDDPEDEPPEDPPLCDPEGDDDPGDEPPEDPPLCDPERDDDPEAEPPETDPPETDPPEADAVAVPAGEALPPETTMAELPEVGIEDGVAKVPAGEAAVRRTGLDRWATHPEADPPRSHGCCQAPEPPW